jgi:hypothetical protein
MSLRRQLAVYSPLTAAAIRRAAWSGFAPGMDGQATLRATLARDYAADQALLFASGTQALQVALELAMRLVGGGEGAGAVALPAFTCFDVGAAAVGARARLRCYDIDPETLTPDLASLQRVLERGTRIVVISPLYGYPVDWDAISALLERYGAIAVEDAAQGHYAVWRGRPVGSLGPISVLSFGRGKGWTGGSGGALLVRDQSPWSGLRQAVTELSASRKRWGARAARAAEARVVGVLTAQWALGRPSWYAIPQAIPWLRLGETVYNPPTAPRPMTRAASACLAAVRPAAAREAAHRHLTATALLAAIGGTERARVWTVRALPGATPGYLRLPLRLDRGLAGFQTAAAATRLGIAPSYPSVLAAIPEIRPWLDDTVSGWLGAEELVRTLVTVPTHSRVRDSERAQLIALLRSYWRQ